MEQPLRIFHESAKHKEFVDNLPSFEYLKYETEDESDQPTVKKATAQRFGQNITPRCAFEYVFDLERLKNTGCKLPSKYPYTLNFPEAILSAATQNIDRRPFHGALLEDCTGVNCPQPQVEWPENMCKCVETPWDKVNTLDWMNENIQLKWRHDIHGIGAFAKTELAKGSVVGEYFGEIEIKGDHCDPNMRFQTSIKLGGEVIGYIDAVRVGSWTRFINHSCNGNVRFEPRRLGNLARNVVKVNRTISAEEEITIDYGDSYWKHWKEKGIHCQCGEASCRLNKAVSGSPPKKEQYGE